MSDFYLLPTFAAMGGATSSGDSVESLSLEILGIAGRLVSSPATRPASC
jgi:hypothetical protein